MRDCAAVRYFLILRAAIALVACSAFANSATPQAGDFARYHEALDAAGTRSFTAAGVPGDPLNIAFVGSEDQLLRLMAQAHWFPADPITFRSSLRITVDSIARKPYADAPVSNLFVQGKKQDLAFEQPAASNPSKRHHVRFWRIDAGGSLWVGAATYDTRIGLSHVNRRITHHIAADVDSERDKLVGDVQNIGGCIHQLDRQFSARSQRSQRRRGPLLYRRTIGLIAMVVP